MAQNIGRSLYELPEQLKIWKLMQKEDWYTVIFKIELNMC